MVQGEEYHLASTFLKKNYLKLILEKTVFRAKLFEDPFITDLGLNSLLGSFPGEPILECAYKNFQSYHSNDLQTDLHTFF